MAAKRLAAAGVDGVMIHSRERDPKQLLEFASAYKAFDQEAPLVVVPTIYAYPSMLKTAEPILKHGRSLEASEHCMSIPDVLNLIPSAR